MARADLIDSGDQTRPARAAGVLFDFGGVLVASPFAAFSRLESANALPDGFVRTLNSRNPDTNAWAQVERGELTVEQFCVQFAAEARELGHEIDAHAVIEPILGLAAAEHRVVPEMLALVRSCRTRGVRTALITNNVVPLRESDESGWIFDAFDAVIESCVVGARKPEPSIYHLALDAIGVDAHDAVMVDDLGVNLKTARSLGMRTIKVVDPVVSAAEVMSLLA